MAITRIFTRDELEDLDVPFVCVDRELYSEHRWYDIFSGVFTDENGDHWRIEWLENSTEMQDQDTWFDEDEITATKVVSLPVVVKKWVDACE